MSSSHFAVASVKSTILHIKSTYTESAGHKIRVPLFII